MPQKNEKLIRAKKAKFDEFYTPLFVLAPELDLYSNFFNEKIIYCNCDNPYESGFFNYFFLNFERLKLKKLITTGFYFTEKDEKIGLKSEFSGSIEEKNGFIPYLLLGDEKYPPGDFRSKECLKYLEEADIVVTNPPFSLFREYVDLLMKYNKKFLIIGNLNSVTCKNIFKYIVDKRLWLGLNKRKSMKFILSKKYYDDYDGKYEEDNEGNRIVDAGNSVWFTNLNYNYEIKENKLVETMLVSEYNPEKYPKYDNFDAIEVSKVSMIPKDYYGVMGVPINYMLVHNPDLFEIVGMSRKNDFCLDGGLWLGGPKSGCYINGKALFTRIFIKRTAEYENNNC